MWRNLVFKLSLFIFFVALLGAVGVAISWVWGRFGPSRSEVYTMQAEVFPLVANVTQASTSCDLSVRHYRQIGSEVQFELVSTTGHLTPYRVKIVQKGKDVTFRNVPHRVGAWLSLPELRLADGPATLTISSENSPECEIRGVFDFHTARIKEILSSSDWIRQGSDDIQLDVRPIAYEGKLYLKDFANYQDGRTKVYLIDNRIVRGLEEGVEVQPGYLYSVIACWIDAPYSEWWNSLRNRTIRQQNIWVKGNPDDSERPAFLTRIPIPTWFTLSRDFHAQFDKRFPTFNPIEEKWVLQYRHSANVPLSSYFRRGVTHLPAWEKGVEPESSHWIVPSDFFKGKDESWFASLPKEKVEALADSLPPAGILGLNFDFLNKKYSPEVKQRLWWFVQRIRSTNPQVQIFDYWGGGAYINSIFRDKNAILPQKHRGEYENPARLDSNANLAPFTKGMGLADVFNVSPVDVFPTSFLVILPTASPQTITWYFLPFTLPASIVSFPSKIKRKTK